MNKNAEVIKQAIAEEILGLTIINESKEDRMIVEEIFSAMKVDPSFLFEKLLVGEPVSVPEMRKLLRKKIINFEFIKLNGDVRPARGTTMMKYIPQKDHPKGIRPSSPKVATFFDLDKKAWRSISNKSKEIVLKYAFGEKEKPVFVVKDKEQEMPKEKEPEVEPKVEKPTEEPEVKVKDVDVEEKPEDVEVQDVEVEEKPEDVEVQDVEAEEKPEDVEVKDVEPKPKVEPKAGQAISKPQVEPVTKPKVEPVTKKEPETKFGFKRKETLPQPKFGFKPKAPQPPKPAPSEDETILIPNEVEPSQFDRDENLPPAKNPPLDIETEEEF